MSKQRTNREFLAEKILYLKEQIKDEGIHDILDSLASTMHETIKEELFNQSKEYWINGTLTKEVRTKWFEELYDKLQKLKRFCKTTVKAYKLDSDIIEDADRAISLCDDLYRKDKICKESNNE